MTRARPISQIMCMALLGALGSACGGGASESPSGGTPGSASPGQASGPLAEPSGEVRDPETPATTGPGSTSERATAPEVEPTAPRADATPRDHLAFFLSGHSLTDDPLADDVVAIARGLGVSAQYNEQIGIGSPIRVRTRGMAGTPGSWEGYRTGKNRGGSSDLDVIAELRAPRTIEGRYDALIITERHDLVGALIWEDTIRFLRHFHDRLSAGNPEATTYLYEPWLGVRDLSDPRAWIAYERAAQPVWDCVADRVDLSLRAEQRPSRVRSIPTGAALATLVERAIAGQVSGLRGANARAITQRIFHDDVHLQPIGRYFVALVTVATVLERSPEGTPAPAGVDPALAAALQSLAWETVRPHLARPPRSPASCRALMRDSFCAAYYGYTQERDQSEACRRWFAEGNADGPFHHDPATEATRWLAAP